MVRIYVISSAIICIALLYASQSGIILIGAESSSAGKPRGPGQFHK